MLLQVWQKPGWPCGEADGVFIQLETKQPKKKLYFMPVTNKEAGCVTHTLHVPRGGPPPSKAHTCMHSHARAHQLY